MLITLYTALYLSVIIIACVNNADLPDNTRKILNNLSSAAFFMTLGATLLTTVLIAYRILSVTRRDPRKGTTRPYKNIAEALVQSAAAYSLVVLLSALMDVIPQNEKTETAIFCADNYTGAVFLVIAVRIRTSPCTNY